MIADFYVIRAMRVYGGDFVQALAEAYNRADEENSRRIRETWPEYWQQYSEMAEQLKKEENEPRQIQRAE